METILRCTITPLTHGMNVHKVAHFCTLTNQQEKCFGKCAQHRKRGGRTAFIQMKELLCLLENLHL